MVLTKEIVSRNIGITGETFDIDKVYKGTKEKGESLGYGFVEQEQSSKPGKYGHELRFKFLFVKEVDDFGINQMEFEFNFENLSKIKGKDHGDCGIKIKCRQTIDYKNRWGKTALNRFLLGVYSKVIDGEVKKKYIIPLINDSNTMHDCIKELFGFYIA